MFYPPIGWIEMKSQGNKLVSLSFLEEKSIDTSKDSQGIPVLEKTKEWLKLYFSHHAPEFLPELDIQGTAFQRCVLECLVSIPFGSHVTYKELGEKVKQRLGKKRISYQAIGQALSKNQFALILPCHRVIGSDGSLRGYRWGLSRKVFLLDWEKEKPND